MKIDIGTIREERGATLPFEGQETIAVIPDLPIEIAGPIQINGAVTNTGNGFLVVATFAFSYRGSCDRCLAPVELSQQTQFMEEITGTDPTGDELGITMKGDVLELKNCIPEQVLLSLPMKLLCKDDCKGFCSSCGKNLNLEACECKTPALNPELEKLRALLSEGGGSNGKSKE